MLDIHNEWVCVMAVTPVVVLHQRLLVIKISTRFFESSILGFTYFGNRLLKASIGMLLSS